MQPTNSELLGVLREIHGDVRVALDRTVTQGTAIAALTHKVGEHGLDLAKAKGQATVFGTVASAMMVGLIEAAKSILGGSHSS